MQKLLNCPFCVTPCGNNYCDYNKEYELKIKQTTFIAGNRKEEVKGETSSTGSLRFNKGKPETSQLDPRFILALADLMTVSAEKYGKFNWALGQQYHTPFDSCMRHLLKFMNGENVDEESGKDHLLHAAANLMILWTSTKLDNEELDTRHNWSK